MSDGRPALHEAAPAKLNLYLHVLGRRPDGYHEIDGLAAFTELSDRLELAPADRRLSLRIDGPFAGAAPPGDDNLALAAARMVARAAGVAAAGAALRLRKEIPVAAGLGGGSADAAAALRGVVRLWELPDDAVDLPALARALGADVPVCLRSRASRMGGIGEVLTPVPPLPEAHLVLANPGRPLLTAAVFTALAAAPSRPAPLATPVRTVAELAAALRERRNDLEPPARALMPEIGEVLEALAAQPGCLLARMSGSGPTCFGLFADAAAAGRAAGRLAAARPRWWVRATELLRP